MDNNVVAGGEGKKRGDIPTTGGEGKDKMVPLLSSYPYMKKKTL